MDNKRILQVTELSTVFRRKEQVTAAVDGITFSLDQGEILGITGLLGSGRSELALALFGINPAEAGTIELKVEG